LCHMFLCQSEHIYENSYSCGTGRINVLKERFKKSDLSGRWRRNYPAAISGTSIDIFIIAPVGGELNLYPPAAGG
jgi:hypothetical protein